ncbi:phage major capsid protein [Citrobacter freundii]|uniref:phage major capsid protein n=1 Tax=Citrobacter TaxID=544 RepID=UPI0022A01A66|nr:phage major capsid protein [Citrobacter freundii]MEA8924174.1 phage major capsid protein [Citrobacter freundii]MEA8929610.1 phage major capsid protein [Citrobacter freundii]HCW3113119.1 phage major capsid protein [Citrobacter amalonaticus]
MNNRAYSLMQVKAVNEDSREITGIASTPEPDRYGDIVDPAGVKFTLPLPLLWQHWHDEPIGQVTEAKVTDTGIEIKAKLVKPGADMPSQLVARLDEAWASIKTGLVRGLSIGFKPIEYSFIDDGGIRFISWEWYELSAVTVPANGDCSIQSVKSIDRKFLAASGNKKTVVKSSISAGATATNTKKGTNSMNIAEQIKSFEAKRAALAASLSDIMSKAADEGRTLDAEETESYDNTSTEIKAVDEHLKRLRDMEGNMASTAKPVSKAANGEVTTVKSATPGIIRVEQKLEKGIAFARFAKALAAANGSRSEALEIARKQYPDDAKLHHVLKAAVGAGTTTDPQWAGALVEYQEYALDFVEFLRPQTIIGRFGQGGIPALRQVPFNIRIPAQTSGGSANWVGQGKAKPLTKFDFESITFSFAKVAAIAVLTDELIRFSNPAADALVRNALAEAVIARLDTDFINPAKAEVANVSPASVTNGIVAIPSTGDPDADAEAAFAQFVSNNLQPTGGVWIMSSTNALALSMKKNALGQKMYPEMTLLGGTFQGLPAIVSQYAGTNLTLLNAPDIYLADDGGVAVDMSREASLEMESEPTGDSITPTGTELVSMFQTNSVAIRAERWINWKRRRTAAVAVISGVNYSSNQGS